MFHLSYKQKKLSILSSILNLNADDRKKVDTVL